MARYQRLARLFVLCLFTLVVLSAPFTASLQVSIDPAFAKGGGGAAAGAAAMYPSISQASTECAPPCWFASRCSARLAASHPNQVPMRLIGLAVVLAVCFALAPVAEG